VNLRDESGQTLVEFALSFVIFIVTVFGILEFGVAVYRYNIVANLAQEGARWASVRGKSVNALAHASTADVSAFVQSRALGLDVTVNGSVTTPNGAPSALDPGQTVSVRVMTHFTPLTGLLPQTQLTLQSTAQMIVSR